MSRWLFPHYPLKSPCGPGPSALHLHALSSTTNDIARLGVVKGDEMPFDFKKYDEKCYGLSVEELQREWQHYTRLITGAATSTTVSGLALPLTMGVSTIGIALAAPAIHNARLKREIVERHLNRHNTTHVTRKRDVLGGAAISGTIGVVTLGVGTLGADAIAAQGAEHGMCVRTPCCEETVVDIFTDAYEARPLWKTIPPSKSSHMRRSMEQVWRSSTSIQITSGRRRPEKLSKLLGFSKRSRMPKQPKPDIPSTSHTILRPLPEHPAPHFHFRLLHRHTAQGRHRVTSPL